MTGMASGSGSGLAKGGLGLGIAGGALILLGIILTYWGPRPTGIFGGSLISEGSSAKFWYLFLIPLFGIICTALAGASFISETRGTGIASVILAFAILLFNMVFMFHKTYDTKGALDFGGYIREGLSQLRVGWYMISLGGLLLILGGMFLSSAFKKERMVKVKEEPDVLPAPAEPLPQPAAQQSQPQAVSVTITMPESAEPEQPPTEEPAFPKSTEPPVPPEELLPPPVDDLPPPPGEDEGEDDSGEDDDGSDEEETEDEEPPEPPPPPPEEEAGLKIEKGYNHIILEDSSKNAFEALKDLTWDETKGLCLSTTFPSKLSKEYGLDKVEKIWISHSSSPEFTAIDPKRLEFEITRALGNFMKDKGSVILIDGLEYLVVENGFENVLKFLKKIGDLSSVNNCTLIISVNPTSLSSDQLTVLKKDFDRVHEMPSKSGKEDSEKPKKVAKDTGTKKSKKK
jgi:hypothetical protein